MKKFIVRGTSFAVIGLVLLFALNFFYVRTNGYKSLNGTFKFHHVPDNINIMNLGSSHGEFGFAYEELDTLTGFNFGLRGQSHYFDLEILKEYSDRLSTGCVVIIPVSCFSLIQYDDYNNQHILYYDILGYGAIAGHDPIEFAKLKLLPVLAASFNIKYLIKDKASVDPDLFAVTGGDEEYFKLSGLYYYSLYEQLKDEGADNGNNLQELAEIIEYCLERGFKPVLITTPFTNQYNYWFSGEIADDFNAAIDGLCKEYGVAFLNYSNDPRFATALEWFGDSDHLNKTGRRVFTRILLTDLGMI